MSKVLHILLCLLAVLVLPIHAEQSVPVYQPNFSSLEILSPAVLRYFPIEHTQTFTLGSPRASGQATVAPLVWLSQQRSCTLAIHRSEQHNFNGMPDEIRKIRADLEKLPPSAAAAEDFLGRIVLTERGGCGFRDKIRYAQRLGASAVLIASNEVGEMGDMDASPAGVPLRIRATMIDAAAYAQILRAMFVYRKEVVVRLGFGLGDGLWY